MSTEYLSQFKLKNLEYVETGDILLFKSINHRNSQIVNIGSRSLWTHIGIAIWEGGELKVFESSFGNSVLDELTGTFKRGVRKTKIVDLVDRYGLIFSRQLNVVRDTNFFNTLNDFISSQIGKSYTSFIKIPFIPFICLEDPGIHCAELVSSYMDALGLFDDKPSLKNKCKFNILPSDFSPEVNDPEVDSLFKDTPAIIIYSKSNIENPSLLFMGVLVMLIAGISILFLTK
jgi:hypothetical protein